MWYTATIKVALETLKACQILLVLSKSYHTRLEIYSFRVFVTTFPELQNSRLSPHLDRTESADGHEVNVSFSRCLSLSFSFSLRNSRRFYERTGMKQRRRNPMTTRGRRVVAYMYTTVPSRLALRVVLFRRDVNQCLFRRLRNRLD